MKFLKIKKAVLIPDAQGHTMTISRIGLHDETGKWIKWIKIKDAYEMLMSEECVIIIHEKESNNN
jgi:hypothetical protein